MYADLGRLKVPLIILVFLGVQFALISQVPLHGDEGLYSLAIKDFQQNGLGLYPRFFGQEMLWKPPLMFIAYAIITWPFAGIIPETILYRIPSLLILFVCAVLFHRIALNTLDENRAMLALILFLASLPIFACGTRVLTDIPALLFTLVGISSAMDYAKSGGRMPLAWLALSIIGAALAKSIIAGTLVAVLSLAYAWFEKKSLTQPLAASAVSLACAALFLNGYFVSAEIGRVLPIDFLPYLTRLVSIVLINFTLVLYYTGPLLIAFIFSAMAFKSRRAGFVDFWALCTFGMVFLHVVLVLAWYLVYFVPALAIIIAREVKTSLDKQMYLVILALALFQSIAIGIGPLEVITDQDEIARYIAGLGNENVLVITKLGENIALHAYGLENVAFVAPENSMMIIRGNTTYYMGVRDSAITPENTYGLIYDYDNGNLSPKFLDQMADSERYFPPVGRTRKHWEGGFGVIVAQEGYAEVVEAVAPDYEKAYVTANGGYSVFRIKGATESEKMAVN